MNKSCLAPRPRSARVPRTCFWPKRVTRNTRANSSTSPRRTIAAAPGSAPFVPKEPTRNAGSASPLAMLPLSSVLRTYLTMAVSSRPLLLKMMMSILQRAAKPSPSLLFDVDRNPVLRTLLYHAFYLQFSAGSDKKTVGVCVDRLRRMGYSGVVLEYARELIEEDGKAASAQAEARAEQVGVDSWRDGLLESIEVCEEGDFLGLKWSGMGKAALRRMLRNDVPSETMKAAMHSVCEAAYARGVRLLPAAEPQTAQTAGDNWTLMLSEKYNSRRPGYALLYNTYQCYLKSIPKKISQHLALAQEKKFTLGLKLVRGAYLHSEPRHLIWETIEGTHACYNEVAEDLLWRTYRKRLSGEQKYPSINVMIASHNQESVDKIRAIRDQQLREGYEPVKLAYAQLYGMADEVSCRLLQSSESTGEQALREKPETYKAATWGCLKDNLQYLVRRAAENQQAFARTADTRDAMRVELWRRLRNTFHA